MMEKPILQKLDDFYIARDHLLAGGTKRRALVKYLPTLNSSHFIYVGSVYGSGGWALAEACKEMGFGCTLHIAKSEYKPDWINSLECTIKWHESQPVEHIYKDLISVIPAKAGISLSSQSHDDPCFRRDDNSVVLPLGFDTPEFKSDLTEVFKEIPITPSEIWLPCVSGVMVRAAQQAWPDIAINAVCVAKHHGDLGNATKYQAPEKYHQRAQTPPPYPSNAFSDAKLWQFASRFALKDALIWNTSA